MKKRVHLSDSSISKEVFLNKIEKEWKAQRYFKASDVAKRLIGTGIPLRIEEKLPVSVAILADTIPQSEEGVIAQTLWDESFQHLIGVGKTDLVMGYSIDLVYAYIHNGDAERALAILELIDLYVPDYLAGEYRRVRGAYIDRFDPPKDNVIPMFPR